MIDGLSRLLDSLWANFLGPIYGGTLFYLSQITAIDEATLDTVLMSLLILATITVGASFLPKRVTKVFSMAGRGTYDKALFVTTLWIWFEINIRLGTRTTIVYLFGNINPLVLGPTSWALAILPSLAQSYYTYKPSRNQFDQQFERTLFVMDVVATAFGLAITAGYTPAEFVEMHYRLDPVVILIWIFAIGGNFWAERTCHDMAFGGR